MTPEEIARLSDEDRVVLDKLERIVADYREKVPAPSPAVVRAECEFACWLINRIATDLLFRLSNADMLQAVDRLLEDGR